MTPWLAPAILLLAVDVDLGEVDSDADLVISVHIVLDTLNILSKIGVFVKLEADTCDTTVPVLEVLHQLVGTVSFLLHPSRVCFHAPVVVEELGMRSNRTRPLESMAKEIINFVPCAFFDVSTINALIDDVPGEGLLSISVGDVGDVPVHESR